MTDISNNTNWSETDASNNQAAPDGWPEGMAPSDVNNAARTMMGAIKRSWKRSNAVLASTGSANAYVLTFDEAPASLATGEKFAFRANFANTGASTLNVNTLGATAITNTDGTALEANAIKTSSVVEVVYDGTAFQLVSNSGRGSELVSDDDGDTYITVEEGADDDTVRAYVNSIEALRITESSGVASVVFPGNITISGTTITNDASTLNVADPLIVLGSGQTLGFFDSGFLIDRGSDNNVAIIWDESADRVSLQYTTDTGATSTATLNDSGPVDLETGALTSTTVDGTTGTFTTKVDGALVNTTGSGSAAAPALTLNSTTHGFFRTSADISLAVSGAEEYVFDATQADFKSNNLVTTGTVQGAAGSGFGITATDGTLHVHTATAGSITANTSADDLVVENSGDGGISIATPDGNTGGLYFGSPSRTDNVAVKGAYNSGSPYLAVDVNGVEGFRVATGGNVTSAGTISGPNLTISTSNLVQQAANSVTGISGSTTVSVGANILLYGQSHATLADDIAFRTATTNELYFDSSTNTWDFQANALTTSGNMTATTFNGESTSAQYADLAEKFVADCELECGDLVMIGGANEITRSTGYANENVVGVVSTKPAYLMNSESDGYSIALTGRVPVKVNGSVKKGDRLVQSVTDGVAIANNHTNCKSVIGRSLEDKTSSGEGLVEAIVRVA